MTRSGYGFIALWAAVAILCTMYGCAGGVSVDGAVADHLSSGSRNGPDYGPSPDNGGGASVGGTVTSDPATGTTSAGGSASGTVTSTAPLYDHVFVIVEENHSLPEILNGGAPYLTTLSHTYASATGYHAVTHPSEPNYLALVAGDYFGVQDDSNAHVFSAPTIATRLEAKGKTWKTYSQGQPRGGALRDAYPYAKKHNPLAFFSGTDTSKLVPYSDLAGDLASAASTPAFSLIVPDLLHDAHDGSVADMDAFAEAIVAQILASPAYVNERSLIVVVFDEDDSSAGNQVPCIFVAKGAAVGNHTKAADHYALLRTVEDELGLDLVGAADASATAMTWMLLP